MKIQTVGINVPRTEEVVFVVSRGQERGAPEAWDNYEAVTAINEQVIETMTAEGDCPTYGFADGVALASGDIGGIDAGDLAYLKGRYEGGWRLDSNLPDSLQRTPLEWPTLPAANEDADSAPSHTS